MGARCEVEQNVIAYQYHGEFYCRTSKSICPATELLVGYRKQSVKEFDKDTNTEGKSSIMVHGALIFTNILLYPQLQLPTLAALAVESVRTLGRVSVTVLTHR